MTFKVKNNGSDILQLTGREGAIVKSGALAGNGIILISQPTDKLSLFANPVSGVNLSVSKTDKVLAGFIKTSDTPPVSFHHSQLQ